MIAIVVAAKVAGSWFSTVRLGRNDWQDAAPGQVLADGVTVFPLSASRALGLATGMSSSAEMQSPRRLV